MSTAEISIEQAGSMSSKAAEPRTAPGPLRAVTPLRPLPEALRGDVETTRRTDLLALAAVLLLCVCLLVVLRLRAFDPMGVQQDSWTEANIVVSARNVARHGWARYGGMAQHQVDRAPFADDPFYLYANYPLGTYYLNWLLFPADAIGPPKETSDPVLAHLRWAPSLCACATLLLFYIFLRGLVGVWLGLAATLALATTGGFLAYADNLHHGYAYPVVLGVMLAFDRAVRGRARARPALLAVAWVCMFASAFLSWEWILSSQLFVWGYALLFGVSFRKRWLAAFALAPILAFAAQLPVRNTAPESSGGDAVRDLLRRTVRMEETADTPEGVTLASYPVHIARRFGQFYGLPFVVAVALAGLWNWLAGGGARWRQWNPAFRLMMLLLACGATWWCVMLQHAAVHPHVLRHALLFYALLVGAIVSAGVSIAISGRQPVLVRLAMAGVVAFVVWSHVAVTMIDVRLHTDPVYVDPRGWSTGWLESTEQFDFAQKIGGERLVLTNNGRLPLLRYWTDVPIYSTTWVRYPFQRGAVAPGSRYEFEMTLNHLRALYGDAMPPLLFAYWFFKDPMVSYAEDPTVWQLFEGTWSEAPDEGRMARFKSMISGGQLSVAYPILTWKNRWIGFDANQLFSRLPLEFTQEGPPTRREYGPPR